MYVVRLGILTAGGLLLAALAAFTSCAPVKFTKADNIVARVSCRGASCVTQAIACDPKIITNLNSNSNPNLTTFTYAAVAPEYPTIAANCQPSDVDYNWVVKKADASIVSASIPGLSGANPAQVDFTGLGEGIYYVFLSATKTGSGLNPFAAANPLEFIVPSNNVNSSLTCEPKLNTHFTSVIVAINDSDAVVTANCNPAAATYLWTATKNGAPFAIVGLSGLTSTPNIKSYGPGIYELFLYATLTGSSHWQSSVPLVVTIQESAPATEPTLPVPVIEVPMDEPTPPPIVVINNIDCNPRLNGSVTDVTLTSASANPLVSANCLPTDAQYTWKVTRNGTSILLSDLNGASSNPDFLSLGAGTYLIYLTTSKPNFTNWNTTTPLSVTVDSAAVVGLSLNCAPRLNLTSTAITITTAEANPVVTSGCAPVTAVHSWSVYKGNSLVAVAGLSGASSTGDFKAAGLGTYRIYLNATNAGYNSFVSPAPLEVTVATVSSPVREVVFEKLVLASNNKVDILMLVDDSNSMAADNAKLAQGLQGFVNALTTSGIDWQICATVTRSQNVYNNGIFYWGASRNWVGYLGSPAWILKTGAADPNAIFTNTLVAIGAGWAGTDDERGIKAAWWSVHYNQYNNCYRNEASLAVILISDEDERSIGGNSELQYYAGEYKTLEADDQPQELVSKIKQKFGLDKRFSFNSIIVTPGDTTCMSTQDIGGAKSHYGFKYSELSQLTGGAVTSICNNDYAANLYYFKDKIINSLASEPLECAPVGDVAVTITPAMSQVTTQIQNNTLIFNPAIPAGRTIKIIYNCARN